MQQNQINQVVQPLSTIMLMKAMQSMMMAMTGGFMGKTYPRRTIFLITISRSPQDPYPPRGELAKALTELGYGGFRYLDMLRYDNGKIKVVTAMHFVIECIGFTEGRWRSFGCQPTLLSTKTVRTEKEYQAVMDDYSLWFNELSLKLYKMTGDTGSEAQIHNVKDELRKLRKLDYRQAKEQGLIDY